MGSVRPVKYGEVRKINVVYFLSRDGQVEHPHLLKIYPVVQSRVRLRDIKKWLSNVRGKDMPDKFSWSYKRRYKTGYVWQDLCDDDLVTPMSDNEYILKGSEILIESTESCKTCSNDKKRSIVQIEATQEQDLPLDTLELDLSVPPDIGNKGQTAKKSYSFDGYSSKEIQPVKNTEKSLSFNEDYQLAVEYIAKLNDGGLGSPNDSGELIRVYKAITSCEKVDAEAQTGDSQRQIIVAEKNSGLTVKSETEGETQVSPKDIEYQDSRVAFEEEDVSRVKIDCHESQVSSGEPLSNSTEISKHSREIAENGNEVKTKNEEVKKGNSDNDESGVASATPVKKILCEQRASLERITRSYSKLSCAKNDVVVAFNENGQPSPRTKKAAASQVIKQLFACGGTETKNSAIKNIKSLSITRSLSSQSRLTTPRSSDSLSVLKASDVKDSPRNISQRTHAATTPDGEVEEKTIDTDSVCSDEESKATTCKCRNFGRRTIHAKATQVQS